MFFSSPNLAVFSSLSWEKKIQPPETCLVRVCQQFFSFANKFLLTLISKPFDLDGFLFVFLGTNVYDMACLIFAQMYRAQHELFTTGFFLLL